MRNTSGNAGGGKDRSPGKRSSVPSSLVAGTDRMSSTQLVRKLANSPALPAFVARLEPRSLQRLISTVGMQDAAQIMELATPQKLVAALDLAVWKSPAPGAAEVLDVDEFTNWLEAWLAIGDVFAAERLLALDEEYLGTALAGLIEVHSIHVRGFEGNYGWKLEKRFDAAGDQDDDRSGFDIRSVDELVHDARWRGDGLDERLSDAPHRPRDEADDFDRDTRIWAEARPVAAAPTDQAFFGEYTVGAFSSDEWDIVLAALNALWSENPDALLAILGRLAASPSMLAAGDHRTVLRDDVAHTRELARAAAGFVTPLGARAFFAGLATTTFDELLEADSYDNETAQYFLRVRAAAESTAVGSADDDDDGIESDAADTVDRVRATAGAADQHLPTQAMDAELASLRQLLVDAGIEAPIGAPSSGIAQLTSDRSRTRADLRLEIDALALVDPDAAMERVQELAYLANTLVMGVRRDGETIVEADAAAIVLATANLGLDWLRDRDVGSAEAALDRPPGVVRVFGIGWQLVRMLPQQVIDGCTRALASPACVERLARKSWLQNEVRTGLADLQRCVRAGEFEGAREAITLLSLVLDAAACRQLRSVLDEVPRINRSADGERLDWFCSVEDLRRVEAWLADLL